uniref:Late embryogenesis abundant protein LEA-2 subgroup domain-containing protein n=1 Tax=Kalanchoe fedtschenkoi TaxID=63787 RepID=A0A7N1A832_KALFE
MLPLPPPPQMEINLAGKENMSTPLNPGAKRPGSSPFSRILGTPRSMWIGTPQAIFGRLRASQITLHQPRKATPVTWCVAIVCLLFSLLLIFFGIATLVIFLAVKPRAPLFDIPSASLSTIYFDSPEYFNGNFNFVANFTNPNEKIDVQFEHAEVGLFFFDKLIAAASLQPFHQRRGEVRLQSVELISSLVLLPQNLAVRLQNQVQRNRIMYNIRGSFKVRANLRIFHYSYWLHGRCELEMTGPPYGVLFARSCKTTR